MNKNLITIVAGVNLLVSTAGFGYVGYNLVNGYDTHFNNYEKVILGVSGVNLVSLGYCLEKANKTKLENTKKKSNKNDRKTK